MRKEKGKEWYYKYLEAKGGLYEDLSVYGIDDISEMNEIHEVETYAEGYIAIGDDGGASVYMMNCDSGDVIKVDKGVINPEYGYKVTNIRENWKKDLIEEMESEEYEEIDSYDVEDRYGIVVTEEFKGGTSDILKIKKHVPNLKSGELLKGARNPPYALVKGLTKYEAQKIVERIGIETVGISVVED